MLVNEVNYLDVSILRSMWENSGVRKGTGQPGLGFPR
jgi:hypothetical protein